jgi:hypothetical protein
LKIDLPISNQTRDIKFKVIASSGELFREVELKLKVLGDITPPLIDRTFPEDEAEEISPDAPIVIWFNEPIDPLTLTNNAVSIIEDESRTEYTGDLQYDQNSNMLIISEIKEDISTGDGEPSGLPYSKLIKITLDTSISDIAGNKLASKYQFKYLTQKKPSISLSR